MEGADSWYPSYKEWIREGERIRETENIRSALPYFQNALAVASNNSEKSNALRHTGLCFEHLGDLQKADEYYKQAIEISEDRIDIARCQRHLLSIELKRGKYIEALALGKLARDTMASMQEPPNDLVWVTHGIVKTLIVGKWPKAKVRKWTKQEFEDLRYMWPREKNQTARRVWLTGWALDASYAWAPWGWVLLPGAFLISLLSGLKIRVRQMLTGKW